MSLQLKSRRVGNINRKIVMMTAVMTLVAQPFTGLLYGATANASVDEPFTVEVDCVAEKAVLKLQTKQHVANWITGKVYYKTNFGQEDHDLSKEDTDVWSVNTNLVELNAGSVQARILGMYRVGFNPFNGYDRTFVVSYPDTNCDRTAPNAPILSASNSMGGVVTGSTTNDTTIKTEWTKPSDDTVKYEYVYWNSIPGSKYKEETPYSVTTTGLGYSGIFSEGDGEHFMAVYAVDRAGNKSARSNVILVTLDRMAPTVTVRHSIGTAPYYRDVSYEFYDISMIDKMSLNGVETDLMNNTSVVVNSLKPGVNGAIEGWNTLVVYDVAGNTVEYSFVLDVKKPVVKGSAENSINPKDFTVMATDGMDGSGIDRVTANIYRYDADKNEYVLLKAHSSRTESSLKVALNTLDNGKYFVKYNAQDKAGAISKTETFYFVVDRTEPSLPVTPFVPSGVQSGAPSNFQSRGTLAPLRTVAFTAANTTTNDGTTETAVEAASNESLVPGKDTLAAATTSDAVAASDVSDKDNNWSVWPLIAIVVAIGAVWGAIATVRRKPTDA